jgi:hypothetical protein
MAMELAKLQMVTFLFSIASLGKRSAERGLEVNEKTGLDTEDKVQYDLAHTEGLRRSPWVTPTVVNSSYEMHGHR